VQQQIQKSGSESRIYFESDGRLIKSLEGNVASHIVHLNQIKSNIDGMIVFKSKTCCEQYVSALKYWHTDSNRLRPRGAESITLGPETELMLKTYMSGNRRITVQQRADGNGDADPGKLPVSFSVGIVCSLSCQNSKANVVGTFIPHPFLEFDGTF
jgi:hypothetical protein